MLPVAAHAPLRGPDNSVLGTAGIATGDKSLNAADLCVYPSIFEGFGLPPLEAMACGTPVVTSNTSSFPEVVGNAALMVDPLDAEALADAIATAFQDDNLQARLAAEGPQRAAMLPWEETARTIMSVYCGTMKCWPDNIYPQQLE